MGMPAAKSGDQVMGSDIHVVLVPVPLSPPAPTSVPHPFTGVISGGLSTDVRIEGRPAAVVGSTADNTPPHVPLMPGSFQKPPTNRATIQMGSNTVLINGKPAARAGDPALTCNDPVDQPVGRVVCTSTVMIG